MRIRAAAASLPVALALALAPRVATARAAMTRTAGCAAASELCPVPVQELPPGAPAAPDGRRGLGASRRAQEILGVFRSPDEREKELVAGLVRLQQEVRDALAGMEALYRVRDYYDLLPITAERDLDTLHASFRSFLADPAPLLRQDARAQRAFAAMFYDTRFRVRAELSGDAERELAELSGGLAVLRAATDGYVNLEQERAGPVARRVDLAAARLRALASDLEALREPPGARVAAPPVPPPVLLDRLTAEAAPAAARSGRGSEAADEARRADRMLALLASRRPPEAVRSELAWREAADAAAAAHLARAELALPENDAGRGETPAEFRSMTKSRRRVAAWKSAMAGLEEDPLDADLAYVAASTARLQRGTLEALSDYDRFLALRGIRSHDDRTYRGRTLDWREEEALYFVQQHAGGFLPGSPLPGD